LSLLEADPPFRKRSSTLSPRCTVLRRTRGLEEGIGRCAGIYLACSCISELRFAPTQRGTVCAVFFEEVRVLESQR
jgi:hypothetical protein